MDIAVAASVPFVRDPARGSVGRIGAGAPGEARRAPGETGAAQAVTGKQQDNRQRMRVKLTAIVLGLIAVGFYVGFILVQAGRS